MDKNLEWHLLAMHPNELNFNEENLAEVKIAGKHLCIAKFNEKLFACPIKCPHAAASLVGGYINVQGDIVCPLHRYKFNLSSGKNTTGEGYYLKTYPIEEREDGWYIGIEKNLWF